MNFPKGKVWPNYPYNIISKKWLKFQLAPYEHDNQLDIEKIANNDSWVEEESNLEKAIEIYLDGQNIVINREFRE